MGEVGWGWIVKDLGCCDKKLAFSLGEGREGTDRLLKIDILDNDSTDRAEGLDSGETGVKEIG